MRCAERGLWRQRPRRLFHREGLAGERRLIDEEVLGLQEQAVARDDVAGVNRTTIARHDLFDRDLDVPAVAQDAWP